MRHLIQIFRKTLGLLFIIGSLILGQDCRASKEVNLEGFVPPKRGAPKETSKRIPYDPDLNEKSYEYDPHHGTYKMRYKEGKLPKEPGTLEESDQKDGGVTVNLHRPSKK